ncbi:NUDIX hydrolase [Myroides indicus]|uniref:8-oxo-dGTP pyrophosphatase MutT (NUDIX family) n=1 Tax=Myroides indicus TaxID=1323422 RepID=A0A4R7F2K5_9FLAO|nr:CoA pyrophosphatase [Myroides indicus]TDS59592.1 8-oxo-dGTP pyrophosphatase MutT (NUDIX family) [Myroides indicus]
MTFDSFLHKIPEIKQTALNGISAHRLMMPKEREPFLNADDFIDHNPKQSAVMMLFYPKQGETYLLLIERATYKGLHSGQIAFPGGKYEKEDVDLMHTALRETNEEVGIFTHQIEVIKPFTKIYIPPSNFFVYPYLGVAKEQFNIKMAPDEVAAIVELPMSTLLDEKIVQNITMKSGYGNFIKTPAFIYREKVIWGATAMILSELKQTLIQVFD